VENVLTTVRFILKKVQVMNNIHKYNRIFSVTGYVSGLFTLFVATIMIFGYLQLESTKPLENPSLETLKEQYDADYNNEDLKEQVRTLDLMARRAFFASRWQIETGTYLLLIGAIIFVLSQRMLFVNKRRELSKPSDEFDLLGKSRKTRVFLISSALSVVILAFIISFLLRKSLPEPLRVETELVSEGVSLIVADQEIEHADNLKIRDNTTDQEPGTNNISEEATDQEIRKDDTSETIPDQESRSKEGDKKVLADLQTDNNLNYPFFRGKGSRGIAPEGKYPTSWDGKTGDNIKWKIKPPVAGFSSPVIWENMLILTGAEGLETEVMCFDKNNGTLLWRAPASGVDGEPQTPPKTTEDTGLAAPTAATNGEVICAIFATGNLVCLDMEGKRIWAHNLGVPDNHYGHSSSLLIHNNTLLVQYDHFKSKSLMAYDLSNGNKTWETRRQVALSWASPVLATFNGVTQVILSSEPFVISYDADSGKEIWKAQCMSGEVGPSVGINSKYVFAVNDFAVLAAINPADGSIIWQDNEYTPEVASPVATEEHVYILTTWGGTACYDTETGDLVWDHDFDYGFYSSPIIAGDNVYMLDQAGVMHVVSTAKEFTLVAESPLGERANCTPAFSEGRIYIRSDEHLYCIED